MDVAFGKICHPQKKVDLPSSWKKTEDNEESDNEESYYSSDN